MRVTLKPRQNALAFCLSIALGDCLSFIDNSINNTIIGTAKRLQGRKLNCHCLNHCRITVTSQVGDVSLSLIK